MTPKRKPRAAPAEQCRAAIYTRVSKDSDGDELAVTRQEKLCRELADREHWAVVDTYVDDNLSAFKRRKNGRIVRPQFDRLLGDIRAGQVDALLAYNPDRLCRDDLRGIEDLIDVLNEFGVAVSTVRAGEFDLSTAHGRAAARQAGVWARLESEKASERLIDKHAELADRGKPNGGRCPIGYRRVGLKVDPSQGGKDTRELVIDPDEAQTVRAIFDGVTAGQTSTRIADELNDKGWYSSTGARWSCHTVRRVALNGLYAGIRIHNGEEVGKGDWPAIVKEATYRRAKVLLTAPNTYRPKRRSARRYLLVGGVARCGRCGGVLRSKQASVRTGGMVPTYVCPGARLGGCGGVSIVAAPLEQLVKEAVIETVESPAFVKALRARAGGDRKHTFEVERLAAELRELEEAKVSGALTLREYLKFRDTAHERLARAQTKFVGDTRAAAVGRFAGHKGALRKWWDGPDSTLDQKQAVVRAVIDKVIVNPVGRGGSVFDKNRVKIAPVA
jgi:DNA invertase Pin-like site-specific DNA recombinase